MEKLQYELLLKIISSITTTEGKGMLLACHLLSDIMRPGIVARRQREARGLLVSVSSRGAVSAWRVADGKRLWITDARAIFVVNIGGGCVLADINGKLRTWDVLSGKMYREEIDANVAMDGAMCIRPDMLVSMPTGWPTTTGAEGISVWELSRYQIAKQRTLTASRASHVTVIGFALGMLVAGYYDGCIRMWDVDTGECVREMLGHTGYVTSVVWLDDGSLLSVSADGSLKVWHSSGQCLLTAKDAHPLGGNGIWRAMAVPDGVATFTHGLVTRWRWNACTATLTAVDSYSYGQLALSVAKTTVGGTSCLLLGCNSDLIKVISLDGPLRELPPMRGGQSNHRRLTVL